MNTEKEVQNNIERNKKILVDLGIEFAVFYPTETGLKKSIIDATHPIRNLFKLESLHNYEEQKQGPDYKKSMPCVFIREDGYVFSQASLYRPNTKKGDPRMWFKYLPKYAEPNDEIAIFIFDYPCHVTPALLNLSKIDLESGFNNGTLPEEFIRLRLNYFKSSSIAKELLNKLRCIAKNGWFPSQRKGDTGIGYTIELLLGKKADSSKKPDYKGIELKSGRRKTNRTTLFAQVPDWSISTCKRSADILEKYGYQREKDFKLYCTVSTQKVNSQGLILRYNEDQDTIEEWHDGDNVLVVAWRGELLRQRLKEKHAETFWIEAESKKETNQEYFKLKSITHTRKPIESQLMPLIADGTITLDHLIKKSDKTNKVTEKGPLFKINKKHLPLLFPEPTTYQM